MTLEAIFVLALLLVAVALFVSERLRPDLVGLLVLSALGLSRILDPKELLHGFSNQAIITIAAAIEHALSGRVAQQQRNVSMVQQRADPRASDNVPHDYPLDSPSPNM